ncbi:Mediator of DNA damage checkpoint protein 1, partial [Entophlyctis sp. JEL0112]
PSEPSAPQAKPKGRRQAKSRSSTSSSGSSSSVIAVKEEAAAQCGGEAAPPGSADANASAAECVRKLADPAFQPPFDAAELRAEAALGLEAAVAEVAAGSTPADDGNAIGEELANGNGGTRRRTSSGGRTDASSAAKQLKATPISGARRGKRKSATAVHDDEASVGGSRDDDIDISAAAGSNGAESVLLPAPEPGKRRKTVGGIIRPAALDAVAVASLKRTVSADTDSSKRSRKSSSAETLANIATAYADESKFVINDRDSEEKFGFRLQDSTRKARESGPFLKGYTIYATKNVKPGSAEMAEIVRAAGGHYLEQLPATAAADDKLIVLGCVED